MDIYFKNVEQVIGGRIFSQISECVTKNDPGHGEEPDAVEAAQDFPVPAGGGLEEGRDVATQAEADEEVACNMRRSKARLPNQT